MGQAKVRGTFEQRKAAAIVEAKRNAEMRATEFAKQEQLEAEEWNKLTQKQKEKRLLLAAFYAGSMVSGKTKINLSDNPFDDPLILI